MACGGCFTCLFKLLNFLITLAGLAMIGYGIYLFVEYNNSSDLTLVPATGAPDLVKLGRPMLMTLSLSDSFFDELPKAWFILVFIVVGVILFVISLFGCIGAVTRNGCCLSFYAVLVLLLILAELGCAAFIFFDKSWREELPTDYTGDFNMIYKFLKENWDIVRWAALGLVVLEALIFILALIVKAANRSVDYDSDDELIAPRQQIRQPFLSRTQAPATGVPVASNSGQPPSRSDAWSLRMREKYGLDTSEFTYNPSESNRYQQAPPQPAEERSRCTIM